jgi:methylated-DNA-[protein]-cysteine S-methyltransferase
MAATMRIRSPLGWLALEERQGVLTGLRFDGRADSTAGSSDVLDRVAAQLAEYFAGRRRAFELPLAQPGTPLARAVAGALAEIGYGSRATYGEVTARLGLEPAEVRKVAAAIGRNPLPILIPCHRVIGADGSLTGYGGGLARKAQLLALEAGQPVLVPLA